MGDCIFSFGRIGRGTLLLTLRT